MSRLVGAGFANRKKMHVQANLEDLFKELSDMKYKVDPDSDESAMFMAKCLSICTQHDLSASDFAMRFDAFRFSNKIKVQCTMEDLDKLNSSIAAQVDADRRAHKSTRGVQIKPEALMRGSQKKAANNFDKESISLGDGGDEMDDMFSDVVVVKKEPDSSPAKRKIHDVADDGEEEQKEGDSRKKANRDEDAEMEDAESSPSDSTPAASAASASAAAAAHLARPFRTTFPILMRGPDGQRNEALYPKALGQYVTRKNAGECTSSLNGHNLARLEPSDREPSAEDLAEWSKRIVEIELFLPSEDLLTEAPEEIVVKKESAAPVSKYASKNTKAVSRATGGIDTTIFRYMYQNDDDLRDGLESNLQESQQIMMDKAEFQAMRLLIKGDAPTLASTLVNKPIAPRQPQIVVKKEPVEEEKKDNDVTMTDASATPASPAAAAASSPPASASSAATPADSAASSSSAAAAPAAAAAATSHEDDEDAEMSNIVPLVSIGASKSQQSVLLAGRVVYDANDTSGNTSSDVVQKLTGTHSVFLEGDRGLNNGARIQVRLGGLPSFALFPGQAILAKGINATGASFVAEEIFTDASLPHLGVRRSNVERFNASLGFRPLGIMMAAGPFTTSEDLSFSPLFDLLRETLRVRPDILILQGPFLDAEHKLLVANEDSIANTYEVLFVRLMADIMAHLASINCKVLIVPSVQDAAAIPIFPQPAFPSPQSISGTGPASADLAREIASGKLHFLPNPCTVRVNDITIGCSSMDIVTHFCNHNEAYKAPILPPGASELGRFQRLASHLITSHSFYPLFPAPNQVYLDYSHAANLRMHVTPDLLFLPSKQPPFASCIESHSSIVVNPQHLTKGAAAGSYALVSIHPLKDEEMVPPNDSTTGRIYDHCMLSRTRVDVLRI